MNELLPFGLGAWIFIGLYLISLIGIGLIAKRARLEDSLSDFYLAGPGFGFFVLFLTLFATQYSGNTFFAFTGATYRVGYAWVMSLHFMTAVVVCYLIYAPQLYVRAKARGYVTPSDYVQDRFDSKLLTIIVTITLIVVLCNFLLAQLMAMGRAMQGLAQIEQDTAYIGGVVVLALIMVIYGTLGGIRAVAWTDAIQGIILMLGFAVLLVLLFERYGHLEDATRALMARDMAAGTRKALPPTALQYREWLSYVLTVGFGVSLYPQAIQRIYAARSGLALRRSLALMSFMPLPTMIIALIAGIMAATYIPGLEGAASDQIFGRVLRDIQEHSSIGYGVVVLLLAAVLAAMMSTADSALLSLSSMFTKDIYARFVRPQSIQEHLTRVAKACSWVAIVALVGLAIALRNHASLVTLMDRKLDLLIQMVPIFMLGLRWPGLRTQPALIGLCVGICVALLLAFGGFEFVHKGKVAGFHPGLVALLPNLGFAVMGSYWTNRRHA
ncbi:MAG: sodium:solute symporter family protein [Proteobacteria bacterium]|nr:sodium:solute symporter family protein [Pseudomonadota bacterium]